MPTPKRHPLVVCSKQVVEKHIQLHDAKPRRSLIVTNGELPDHAKEFDPQRMTLRPTIPRSARERMLDNGRPKLLHRFAQFVLEVLDFCT